MPAEFKIGDDDIAFAESQLLPMGANFDEERRQFIKCLDTADLQAVPGSGKTTALLAKLLVLDRHLPFLGCQGVLVISHTNAAVNEIRERIGGICPKLFTYPNFVGTIQSFVDTFLAIPSFVHEMGFRPSRIDADAYNSEISRRFQSINAGAKSWVERKPGVDPEEFVRNLRFDSDLNLTNGLGGKVLLKRASNSPTYKTLAGLKLSVLRSGLLHYEDVFWFAEQLLQGDAKAKRLLQMRFNFVFVDEMQDMAPHQHIILEGVFGPASDSNTIFQRIGDTDQAIFGGSDVVDTDGWQLRTKTLTLSNSMRLSPTVADILAPFAYERDESFKIAGLQPSTILPHLLIYDDDSIGAVVELYASIIAKLRNDGRIPTSTKGRYMAVAWNSVWNEATNPAERRRRLIDFCPSFQQSALKKQEEFESLADYLYGIDGGDMTLRSARNGILKAVCRSLRLGEVVDPRNDRPFTPTSLVSYFHFEGIEENYGRLNRALLKWSLNLVAGKTEATINILRKVIPKLISYFGGKPASSHAFLIGALTVTIPEHTTNENNPNTLTFGDIQIGLGTVHSVKGQTHTATLYIESAYYNDGGKMYESQRLAGQFRGERLSSTVGKRIKESAKMVYVGFSRPTHLLVFAIHKENFDSYLPDIDTTRWEIVHADQFGSER